MAEIQQLLVDETLKFIDQFAVKAKVTIDGNVIEKDIYKSRMQGDTLRKYVYLQSEKGLVTRAALVDNQGRELYTKELNYQKESQGFMIVFPITQKIEVK